MNITVLRWEIRDVRTAFTTLSEFKFDIHNFILYLIKIIFKMSLSETRIVDPALFV